MGLFYSNVISPQTPSWAKLKCGYRITVFDDFIDVNASLAQAFRRSFIKQIMVQSSRVTLFRLYQAHIFFISLVQENIYLLRTSLSSRLNSVMRLIRIVLAALTLISAVNADSTCSQATGSEIFEQCDQQQNCKGTCCFQAGTCQSSTANNCFPDTGTLFPPPTSEDNMRNHNVENFEDDGCFCNIDKMESGGETKIACPDGAPHCWGIIDCTEGDEFTCNNLGQCFVSRWDRY